MRMDIEDTLNYVFRKLQKMNLIPVIIHYI